MNMKTNKILSFLFFSFVILLACNDDENQDSTPPGSLTIENITPILKPHRVFAGQNNGIHGGIKDIKYYDRSLNNNEINSIYNNYI